MARLTFLSAHIFPSLFLSLIASFVFMIEVTHPPNQPLLPPFEASSSCFECVDRILFLPSPPPPFLSLSLSPSSIVCACCVQLFPLNSALGSRQQLFLSSSSPLSPRSLQMARTLTYGWNHRNKHLLLLPPPPPPALVLGRERVNQPNNHQPPPMVLHTRFSEPTV